MRCSLPRQRPSDAMPRARVSTRLSHSSQPRSCLPAAQHTPLLPKARWRAPLYGLRSTGPCWLALLFEFLGSRPLYRMNVPFFRIMTIFDALNVPTVDRGRTVTRLESSNRYGHAALPRTARAGSAMSARGRPERRSPGTPLARDRETVRYT